MNHHRYLTCICLTALVLASAGCTMEQGESEDLELDAEPDLDEGPIGEADSALSSGAPVPSGFLSHIAARVGNCTGVIVGYRDVLTAAHCQLTVGGIVRFYDGPLMTAEARVIDWISYPLGVDAASGDYTDSSGNLADIAYVRLNDEIPATSLAARMAITYPGNEVSGKRVGAGMHYGNPNLLGVLYSDDGTTYSSSVSGGQFLLNESDADQGDSGGPFLVWASNGSSSAYEVQGVLKGTVFEWAWRTRYTSTVHHINWIAQRLTYNPADYIDWTIGQLHQGTVVKTLNSVSNYQSACSYHCRQRDDCVGVNYLTLPGQNTCQMLSNITNTVPYATSKAGTRIF